MKTILRRACLILCLILGPGLSAAAVPEAAPPLQTENSEYTITVIPFFSPEKIWALYTPFIDFLKQSTGKPWSLKLFPTHKTLINALCSNQVSFALLGPVPLGRVIAQCNAEPIVVAISNDGTPFYRSIIVSTDPAVTSLEKLRGKRFGFFKGSTAAHILPRQILQQSELNNDVVPVFYEGQDHIVNALMRRQVTAAGLKESLFNRFKDNGFRVLAISDPAPNFAFAAAPGASSESKKLFADRLLRLAPAANDSEQKIMAGWDAEIRHGFIPPTSAFRNAVKDLLSLTDVIMREDR